jgi:hypothetical protein
VAAVFTTLPLAWAWLRIHPLTAGHGYHCNCRLCHGGARLRLSPPSAATSPVGCCGAIGPASSAEVHGVHRQRRVGSGIALGPSRRLVRPERAAATGAENAIE